MRSVYYLFSVKHRYFTDLSLVLKQKKYFDRFYGMAYAKHPSLENSIYSHVSYISDIINEKNIKIDLSFLTEIENKYHVCVSELIHTDRHLMRLDKEKRLYIAQEMTRIFIREVLETKAEVVFAEAIDDYISFFASIFCREHNIQFLYTGYLGLEDALCFSNRVDGGPIDLEEKFDQTCKAFEDQTINVAEIDEKLTAYVEARKKPAYFLAGEMNYRIFNFQDVKIFFRYMINFLKDTSGLYFDKNPLSLPYHRIIRVLRKVKYGKFIRKNAISIEKLANLNYFIYPLHFQPEATTLIQGRWLHDQPRIIEMISKSLPAGYWLLVKEHKGSIGRRPLSYYKEINQYHNVAFVSDTMDNYELIKYCKGVTAISSTMGLEALLQKRPVLSFGEKYYNISKNVYQARDYRNIKENIDNLINHKFDHTDVAALYYTLVSSAKHFGFGSPTNYSSSYIDKISDELKLFLNET